MIKRFAPIASVLALASLCALRGESNEASVKSADAKPEGQPLSGSIRGATKTQTIPNRSVSKAGDVVLQTTYSKEYLRIVAEAIKSFKARDFRGAISFADKADALIPPTAYTLNVRGAVAIEQRKFDEGFDFCLRALKVEPGFFPARFNLCEIPFNKGEYKLAREGLTILYNETEKDDPTIELLVYRIFLTYLFEDDAVHANEWKEKIPFPSQTPAYQYANAAWERKHGRIAKWHDWLRSAEFIWPEVKRVAFADVLIHVGWLNENLAPNDGAK